MSSRASFVFAFVLLLTSSALAQREVAVDRFRPAPDRYGFIGVQGTRTPGHLQVDASLWMSWTEDLVEAGAVEVIDHRFRTDFLLQLGLGGRVAAALDVPVVWYQTGQPAVLDGGGDLPTVAGGDPRLALRVRLLGDPTDAEVEGRAEGLGLAALGSVTLPVGADTAFTGEESALTTLGLLGDFRVLGAAVGLSLDWRHRFQDGFVGSVRFRDELHYGLGIEVPLPVADGGLSTLVELRGWFDARFEGRARTGLEGDLGVRWQHGEVALTGAVGTNFNGDFGVGSPLVRGLVGLSWSPREHDADGDGIPDDEDECAHLPEDFDGFEDSDGCLDPDNDQDLVPDADDACPNEAAAEGRDDDFDGCTDPVRDSDRDGIEDRDDACPRRSEDQDGFEDGDGCPDVDNDQDGLTDRADRCPLQAEDRDGYEDRDGCPDPDDDGDGIADADDRCPRVPEDADGNQDGDGCPDPDDDRDGVLDADDQCPEERETINGRNDADGCPDRGGRGLWRLEGEPGTAEATLTGAVRFLRDGSLSPIGRLAVRQLALHVIAAWPRPAVIALSEGDDARLASVRQALSEAGVPSDRLRLVEDGDLRGARARVTFRDASAEQGPAETPSEGSVDEGAPAEPSEP